MKLAQRDEMKEKQRLRKEGIVIDATDDTDPDIIGNEEGDGDENEDDVDLFGPEEGTEIR